MSMNVVDLQEYDFELPPELVAHEPTELRDNCRFLYVSKNDGHIEKNNFKDIGKYLRPGDLVVLNDTRVIRGKFFARRPDGGRVEVNLYSRSDDGNWIFLIRPSRRLFENIILKGEEAPIQIELHKNLGHEIWEGKINQSDERLFSILEDYGEMSIPLYITLGKHSEERYQTVFAQKLGATQAPTAGLHFTSEIIDKLSDQGINFAYVTLHVGLGTLVNPKHALEDKKMYREWIEVTPEAATKINSATGRIIAVGTTVVRSLETVGVGIRKVEPYVGWTELFISPGYEFKIIDGLFTNFHQPMSTRILLVAAFLGKDWLLNAYNEAVKERYMFYDFGDSMLIL